MGFATNYLASTRMAQDLAKAMGTTKAPALEFMNKHLTCAIIRWQQWFENPYVDREVIKLKEPSSLDFANYRNTILRVLTKNLLTPNKLGTLVNQVLLDEAQNLVAPGPDFQERMVTLLTMGACEFHGFNGAFTQSIKQNGLNPNTKFTTEKDFAEINKIFKRVGRPLNMERAKEDQDKIYVTPDPHTAYHYAETSPEWFYFFCNANVSNYFDYANRNYEPVLENLLKFPGHEKLTIQDSEKIVNFFNHWWAKLTSPDSKKIAIMPMFRNKTELQNKIKFNLQFVQKLGLGKLLEGSMYAGHEHVYTQPIAPEFLQIIDIPSTETHTQRLIALHDKLQQADQALAEQTQAIQSLDLGRSL